MFIVVSDVRDISDQFEIAFPAPVPIVRENLREFAWRLSSSDIDGVTAVVFDARNKIQQIEFLVDSIVLLRRIVYLFAVVPAGDIVLAGDLAHRGIDRCIADTVGAVGFRDILLETLSMYRSLSSPIRDVPELQSTLIGKSRRMQILRDRIRRVAAFDDPVLVTGETGVGKDLVARAVHRLSARRDGPFQAINITAVTESLFESELFGARSGAYTGAVESEGVWGSAQGGTVFLDEIGDLPVALQPKLLRAVESGAIRRVGDTKDRHVSVRLVSATNRELQYRIKTGSFRRDLWHRISTIKIAVPPLRERLEDIEEIAYYILESRGYGSVRLSRGTIQWFQRYTWPGNVRELGTVLIRAVLNAGGDVIRPGHIELDEHPIAEAGGDRKASTGWDEDRMLAEREPGDLPGLLPN